MEDLQVSRTWVIPASAIGIHFARSGGPGGQNVNKLNTKAEVRVRVADLAFPADDVRERFLAREGTRVTAGGELLITSQVHRSQAQNLEECLGRLVGMLRAALIRPRVRRATRPTAGSRQRRIEAKRARARRQADRKVSEE